MRWPLGAEIIAAMRYAPRLFALICALLIPSLGLAGQAVTVFAAASLRDALEELAAGYEGEVVTSYGGSGLIARQVDQGAPADIVLLANSAWMDWLQERGAIEADSRIDLLGNRLVLVGPAGAAPLPEVTLATVLARLDGGRLAMGHTQGVPAGIYGRQWLETAGLWADLAPHLAETESVRAALALVSRGEAPLGVVYATDAQADEGVAVLYDIPADTHGAITYPVAIVGGKNSAQATDFISFLRSDKGADVFRKHGFLMGSEAS